MAQFDLPLAELQTRQPRLAEPDDLDAFWSETLEAARTHDTPPRFDRIETGLALLDTYDVRFAGFGGHPIRGWLHVPRGTSHRNETIVEYVGAGGGRGLAHEPSFWVLSGRSHFVMDNRGQGSGWRVGHTADPGDGGAPAAPGFATRGLHDPREHYYRRLITDAVRAVDAVRTRPDLAPGRVVLAGMSQGGGVAIAAAALTDGIAGLLADVPYLCDFARGIAVTDSAPYAEIAGYLAVHRGQVERALTTLAYVDAAVLASRADAPALFSVALADVVCPPSTVYAAYHRYGGVKQMAVYPFNGHEGGGSDHSAVQLAWLDGLDGAARPTITGAPEGPTSGPADGNGR